MDRMDDMDDMEADEGLGSQSIEDFWGAELSSKQKQVTWEDNDDEDELEGMSVDKTLELRQACLGLSAKDGERNVVQVTAENEEGEKVKHTILSLRVGGTEQCSLFLTLNPPISLELVSGSGPVHIVGTSIETLNTMGGLDDASSSDDDDEDIEVPSSEIKALVNSAKKKRPANSPVAKPAKQIKLDKSTDNSTTDSSSMDTSGSNAKRSKKKQAMPEPEESDDDDDEDDEDDDMSDDDSSLSFDEDEEEIEEVKPPTKKPQGKSNGKQNNGKPKQKEQDLKSKVFKTPQPPKKTPKGNKGTVSAPTTPKQKGSVKSTGPKRRNNNKL